MEQALPEKWYETYTLAQGLSKLRVLREPEEDAPGGTDEPGPDNHIVRAAIADVRREGRALEKVQESLSQEERTELARLLQGTVGNDFFILQEGERSRILELLTKAGIRTDLDLTQGRKVTIEGVDEEGPQVIRIVAPIDGVMFVHIRHHPDGKTVDDVFETRKVRAGEIVEYSVVNDGYMNVHVRVEPSMGSRINIQESRTFQSEADQEYREWVNW